MSDPTPKTPTQAALDEAAAWLAQWTTAGATPEADRLDLTLPVEHLLNAVGVLAAQRWGFLSAITALDHGPASGRIEVLYHFCAGAAVLTLRVSVPRDAATVPSICPVTPSARLYEQELRELMGVGVDGLPEMGRLFLADDWPSDIHPLRKDAPLPERTDP